VAEEFGEPFTTAQVRGTERRALKKLRSPVVLSTHKLLTFLDLDELNIALANNNNNESST